MLQSEAYKLQYKTTIDGKIITAGELVVKAEYLCYTKVETNLYQDQHTQQHFITVPTCKILHTQIEVNAVTYYHARTKSVCNRTQAKKAISRHPLCLTDSDYNYILEEIYFQEKMSLKEM